MSRKIIGVVVLTLLSLGLLTVPALAQDTPASTPEAGAGGEMADVLVSGLNNPRNLFFGADGNLYIAEAGFAGETQGEGPFGPAPYGNTGQISAVSPDGEWSVIVPELLSLDNGFGQIEGPMAVYVTEDAYWVVLGIGPREVPEGQHVEAVVEIAKEGMAVGQVIDLRAWEAENNPDQGEELVSNPADIAAAEDGTLYIVDASGNSLLAWTEAGGIELFAAWPVSDGVPSAVPTSVSIGPDGDIYVGFLSGFPFPPGGARVERYGADGTLKQTYDGLTLVTDILVDADGILYAVEMASGFGDTGYNANSGRVVTVAEDGTITAVAEGLNIPYGLAQDAEGGLWVTVNSAFAGPDSGSVVHVGGM